MTVKLNVTSKWPSVWRRAHAMRNVNLDAIIVIRDSVDVKWMHRLRRLNVKNKLRTCMLSVYLHVQKATSNVLGRVREKMVN